MKFQTHGIGADFHPGALVPPILKKSQLEKPASEQIGPTLTVGTIDFKPWTLELRLEDMAVAQTTAASAENAQTVADNKPVAIPGKWEPRAELNLVTN